MFTFKISEALYPRVYTPYREPEMPGRKERTRDNFGLSIKAEELPEELRAYVRQPREFRGVDIVFLTAGGRGPAVVTVEGGNGASQLHTILNFARDANISPDDLLSKISMELAVDVVEFYNPTRREPTKTARLQAIRVRYTDLLHRYDALLAEPWK